MSHLVRMEKMMIGINARALLVERKQRYALGKWQLSSPKRNINTMVSSSFLELSIVHVAISVAATVICPWRTDDGCPKEKVRVFRHSTKLHFNLFIYALHQIGVLDVVHGCGCMMYFISMGVS